MYGLRSYRHVRLTITETCIIVGKFVVLYFRGRLLLERQSPTKKEDAGHLKLTKTAFLQKFETIVYHPSTKLSVYNIYIYIEKMILNPLNQWRKNKKKGTYCVVKFESIK